MRVTVYFSVCNNQKPIFTGPRANVIFTREADCCADNEKVFETSEMSQDDYDFMVEYWDDTLERHGTPEVYRG